jgi:hypothetical protein
MCLLTDLPVAQLESILAHELAHVRRHDYLANLLQTLVETLFFYHPAVWWLSRQIRNERENCCDDVAMAAVGSRADYGRALLAIEELRGGPAKFSLSARGGSLLARIRRVAGCEPAPPVIVSGSVLGVVLVSIVTVGAATWGAAPAAENVQDALSPTKAGDAATSPAPTASQDPFAPPGKTVEKAKKRYAVARTMRIRVVGPDDKPVAGTHVMVRATMKGKRWDEVLEDYTCDADGKAVIELPQGVTALHLELWKKGYFRHLADREETQPAGSRPLPEDITIKLTKPTPAQVEAVAALENTRRDTIRVEESDKGRRVIIELTWHTGLRLLHLLPDPDELLVVAPNMTDADLANLEGLRGLKALSLVGDKITDAGLAHLEGLRGLKELQLICPEITDAGLAHLQPLHALEKLTLACSVTDAGMKHLTPLKELRTLIARRIESDPATHEVFHALVQLTNVEGLEERLDNVCDYLGDYHRIKVRFDEVALGSAKIDGRIPVTINVKNVPLVATLGLLLRPHGLDWTVGKGTLLITTRDIGPRGTPGTAALQQALPSLKQVYVDW